MVLSPIVLENSSLGSILSEVKEETMQFVRIGEYFAAHKNETVVAGDQSSIKPQ